MGGDQPASSLNPNKDGVDAGRPQHNITISCCPRNIFCQLLFRTQRCALEGTHQVMKKTSKYLILILKSLQVTTLLALLILILLYNLDLVGYNILNGVALGMNMLIVLSFLITFFYLNFKMTGIMMENTLNEVVKRIYKVQLIILLSRTFSIAFEISVALYVVPDTFEQFIDDISANIKYEVVLGMLFVGSVLFVLITEGLPIMYSLRSSVI